MSSDRSPRLNPLPEAEWAAQADSVRGLLGEVLNVHRVMAHHPELLAAWAPLRQHVAAGSSLSPRFRELAILRVAHRMGVSYEWYHHVRRALVAEMTAEEIEAIRLAPDHRWQEAESVLLTAVDELHDHLNVTDSTWAALARLFTTDQILDLLVTVGTYTTLAMVINATGVEIEAG
ncbi:MAG: carboxymuconolactone decarboxylase family protein [Acidimicrobiia bacterium]|nr:carboxymuconolactone decarboxylase family protein [Acidimicrobiia bacterium]